MKANSAPTANCGINRNDVNNFPKPYSILLKTKKYRALEKNIYSFQSNKIVSLAENQDYNYDSHCRNTQQKAGDPTQYTCACNFTDVFPKMTLKTSYTHAFIKTITKKVGDDSKDRKSDEE